jgi:hypothetical protein
MSDPNESHPSNSNSTSPWSTDSFHQYSSSVDQALNEAGCRRTEPLAQFRLGQRRRCSQTNADREGASAGQVFNGANGESQQQRRPRRRRPQTNADREGASAGQVFNGANGESQQQRRPQTNAEAAEADQVLLLLPPLDTTQFRARRQQRLRRGPLQSPNGPQYSGDEANQTPQANGENPTC